MTESELIDLINSDLPIGIKEFISLRDHYILCMASLRLGYSHNQAEYIGEYVRFLENHFMEDL